MTLGNNNGTDGQTDRQIDRRTDRVQRNMRPPPREEGRIISRTSNDGLDLDNSRHSPGAGGYHSDGLRIPLALCTLRYVTFLVHLFVNKLNK